MSEFLRVEQRENQVAQQQDGKYQRGGGDEVNMHGLPQLLTRLDVKERQAEENNGEEQHRDILHCRSRSSIRQSRFVGNRLRDAAVRAEGGGAFFVQVSRLHRNHCCG